MNALEQLERALGPTTAEAIRALIAEEVARARAQDGTGAPWMSVEETAALLRVSPGAIHQRVSQGWLAGETAKDGRRRFLPP